MAFRLATNAANACGGDGTNAGLRAFLGSGPLIKIYVGAQNTTPESAPAGTLLGTCTVAGANFGAASSGVITASTITSDSSADNSGTAGSFWLTLANGSTPVADGTCGVTSGYELNFTDNNVIVAGGIIAISSFAITVPPH